MKNGYEKIFDFKKEKVFPKKIFNKIFSEKKNQKFFKRELRKIFLILKIQF